MKANKKVKAKLALLEASSSTSQTPKIFQPKNKGMVAETFKWDEEEVSDDEKVTQVKMLMDEKINKKTHEKKPESSNSGSSSKVIQDVKSNNQNSGLSKSLKLKPQLKYALYYYTNHSTDDCYRILYCVICKREDHRNSDHKMYTALLKRIKKYKAQPYQYASPSKQILKSKAKPFPSCTHYGFNDHRPDDCRNYPECEIYRSYDHTTLRHNHVIHIKGGVLAESSQSCEYLINVKCNICGRTIHSTSDHNEFEHFKRVLALSDRHHIYHETPSDQETATYGRIWDDDDVHNLRSVETEFSAIDFDNTFTSQAALSCKPMVNPLNDNEFDFRISFDESNDEDYTVFFDKNSFSYKIIFVDNLKTDSENDNDKVNMPSFLSPEPTIS
nr:hypothetical protein [Tanacetum cinerariifolium]